MGMMEQEGGGWRGVGQKTRGIEEREQDQGTGRGQRTEDRDTGIQDEVRKAEEEGRGGLEKGGPRTEEGGAESRTRLQEDKRGAGSESLRWEGWRAGEVTAGGEGQL